jgi:hypothetical protein
MKHPGYFRAWLTSRLLWEIVELTPLTGLAAATGPEDGKARGSPTVGGANTIAQTMSVPQRPSACTPPSPAGGAISLSSTRWSCRIGLWRRSTPCRRRKVAGATAAEWAISPETGHVGDYAWIVVAGTRRDEETRLLLEA